jgi:hypothetical protein
MLADDWIYAQTLSPGTSGQTVAWGQTSVTDDANYYMNINGDHVQSTIVFIELGISSWNRSSVKENAKTIIHELGHVFNMLLGAGGSKFAYDADPTTGKTDFQKESFNADLEKQCLP